MSSKNSNENLGAVAITAKEAWEIISNQVEVQEQLRTKGERTLQILSTLVVLAAGASLAFDFSAEESEIQNVADSIPTTAQDISGTLLWNWLIMLFLLIIALALFFFFIYRNYELAHHSPLQPSLGEHRERPFFVIESNEKRRLINNLGGSQYGEWIKSNNEKIAEKRRQLDKANIHLYLCIFSVFISVLIYQYTNDVFLLGLLTLDIFFIFPPIGFLIGLIKSRDKPMSDWSSWPLTEQQKSEHYYITSGEFVVIIVLYIPIFLLSLYVVQHYIRSFFWHINDIFLIVPII